MTVAIETRSGMVSYMQYRAMEKRLTQFPEYPIPELNARPNCHAGRRTSFLQLRFISGAQFIQQLQGDGAVKIGIQMDMAIQVIMKDGRVLFGDPHVCEKRTKHTGNNVFAP